MTEPPLAVYPRLQADKRLTIHSTELRPHLNRHAQDDTPKHARCNELLVGGDGLFAFEPDDFLDFFVLGEHPRVLLVALAVQMCKCCERFLPAVFTREPTWRVWQEPHSHEQDSAWNHLDAPWNTESGCALTWLIATTSERRTVLDKVLDKDTPVCTVSFPLLCLITPDKFYASLFGTHQVIAHC